jgi:hypothetical protein
MQKKQGEEWRVYSVKTYGEEKQKSIRAEKSADVAAGLQHRLL